MPEFTAKELRKLTDEELSVKAERHDPKSSECVLVSMEFRRRLMKKQVILSVILSSILGMIGIASGALLQYHLGKNREESMLQKCLHTHTENPCPAHQTKPFGLPPTSAE